MNNSNDTYNKLKPSLAGTNPTYRFSNRVENYLKYRPGYPIELAIYLKTIGIQEKIIADIGSGTGISAKLFLDLKCTVYGIEPNKEMREAGETFLSDYPEFKSINATAEFTSLTDHSVDAIVVAQAFHWFDKEKCKLEFERILKPNGYIVLIWNDRVTDRTPFLKAYEELLISYAIDYKEVNHKNIDEKKMEAFFVAFKSKNKMERLSFKNYQVFNYQGLEGRLLSSSYVPTPNHPNYEPMLTKLQQIFDEYNKGGKVTIEYDTIVYAMKVER